MFPPFSCLSSGVIFFQFEIPKKWFYRKYKQAKKNGWIRNESAPQQSLPLAA